jgi:DNA-binding TFAR19-related protein (PDSD5 family)
MTSLEEIKRRKLEELMKQQSPEQQQLQQTVQQIHALESQTKQYLTKEAYERYCNLKVSHSEKAIQLLGIIHQLIINRQIQEKLDDKMLKNLLIKLTPQKQETKIKRI